MDARDDRSTPTRTLVFYAFAGFVLLAVLGALAMSLGLVRDMPYGDYSGLAVWPLRIVAVAVLIKIGIDRWQAARARSRRRTFE